MRTIRAQTSNIIEGYIHHVALTAQFQFSEQICFLFFFVVVNTVNKMQQKTCSSVDGSWPISSPHVQNTRPHTQGALFTVGLSHGCLWVCVQQFGNFGTVRSNKLTSW